MALPKDFSSMELEIEVAQELAITIDSPRSLTVFLLIKYQEFDQLVNLEIDPSHYNDYHHFSDDYLVTKVLSKSRCLPTSYDLKKGARDSFWAGEAQCADTNQRWNSPSFEETCIAHAVAIQLERMIGPCDRSALDFIETSMRHGPGATFDIKGTGSVPSDKFRKPPSLTYPLLPFARAIKGPMWANCQHSHEIVEGNRFTTVPKTSKTDRGICIEPTLNVFIQLGIGAYIRKRLKHFGCDLRFQEWNQHLASVAMDYDLSTIDLSLASDSLSWSVVQTLLPYKWFELLDTVRSHTTQLPNGSFQTLEKFSSMGNGFTFELESLVFLAIVYSIVPEHLHCHCGVYGDDIIVPRTYAKEVVERLKLFGFSVNSEKTFLAGRFFESCGSDWFNGRSCRPFYLRSEPSSKDNPYPLKIANRLRLYAKRRGALGYCDGRFRKLWLSLFHLIPKERRRKNLVPEEYGDGGIIVSESEAIHLRRPKHGEEGRFTLIYSGRLLRRLKPDYSGYLAFLSARSYFSYGYEPVRGFLRRPKASKAIVRWPKDLEWC